jgi:hypothetical protein
MDQQTVQLIAVVLAVLCVFAIIVRRKNTKKSAAEDKL